MDKKIEKVTRKTCEENFDGSWGLFLSCWKVFRRDVFSPSMSQDECDSWLEALAAEKVNNPKTKWHIWG